MNAVIMYKKTKKQDFGWKSMNYPLAFEEIYFDLSVIPMEWGINSCNINLEHPKKRKKVVCFPKHPSKNATEFFMFSMQLY